MLFLLEYLNLYPRSFVSTVNNFLVWRAYMETLNWEKLLSSERERASSRKIEGADSIIARNAFEADYDRIVGSSSVRRLQDKAQVFPLQENDVARTRLTHSIEVSALARSLGKAVGRQLEKRSIFTSNQTEELAALLQVAGLIHDLGNPPFGHYGEDVIRSWFENWFKSNPVLAAHNIVLTEQEQYDFRYFDGNVQNLRIVSKLQAQNDIYGANFTFATLGTIMKYPWQSNKCPDGKAKFGYFASEAELAIKVRCSLGLNENVRHPATYLLEAADDIIYLCDDIEDGAKKGCINWSDEFSKIQSNLEHNNLLSPELSKLFDSIQNKVIDPKMGTEDRKTSHVRNFRNFVQSFLFTRAIEEFLNRYDDIMSNDYNRVKGLELLNCESGLVEELKRVTAENCFSCREVLELELNGHNVISTLLDIFVKTLIESSSEDLSKTKTYAGKIFSLISSNFKYIALAPYNTDNNAKLKDQISCLSTYDRLHLVTDFISGMTDSYAVDIFQKLTGIKHP